LNKPTYKECLMKGVDPLDGEYIDWKLDEKFEELKKEYNAKFDISFSDEDIMKIGGQGQKPEE
jgi:hypothetical protein